MTQVRVTTGARLHFGLLAHKPETGRMFGGAGLMIESPGTTLIVGPHREDVVDGCKHQRDRVLELLSYYRERCPKDFCPPPCHVQIESAVPRHCGLGSGTQMALALARALAILAAEGEVDLQQLVDRVARGRRSALGIHGFQRGGFLIDAGKAHAVSLGCIIARHEFPAPWRLLLARPRSAEGIHGQQESAAFERLSRTPVEMTDTLCGILVRELAPAIVEEDFEQCSRAIFEFGETVGRYFSSVQSGVYAHDQMAQLVAELRIRGIEGVGQSSWGPTIFALCRDSQQADRLKMSFEDDPEWDDCTFHVAAPQNRGASIEVLE